MNLPKRPKYLLKISICIPCSNFFCFSFFQNPLHCLCLSKIVYISISKIYLLSQSDWEGGGKENNNFD